MLTGKVLLFWWNIRQHEKYCACAIMKKYGVVVLIYTQTIVPIISDLPFCQKLGDYPKSFSENLKIYIGWKFRFSIFTLLTVKIIWIIYRGWNLDKNLWHLEKNSMVVHWAFKLVFSKLVSFFKRSILHTCYNKI